MIYTSTRKHPCLFSSLMEIFRKLLSASKPVVLNYSKMNMIQHLIRITCLYCSRKKLSVSLARLCRRQHTMSVKTQIKTYIKLIQKKQLYFKAGSKALLHLEYFQFNPNSFVMSVNVTAIQVKYERYKNRKASFRKTNGRWFTGES